MPDDNVSVSCWRLVLLTKLCDWVNFRVVGFRLLLEIGSSNLSHGYITIILLSFRLLLEIGSSNGS